MGLPLLVPVSGTQCATAASDLYSLTSMPPTFTSLGSGRTALLRHDAGGSCLAFALQVETLASQGQRAR